MGLGSSLIKESAATEERPKIEEIKKDLQRSKELCSGRPGFGLSTGGLKINPILHHSGARLSDDIVAGSHGNKFVFLIF